MRERHSLKLKKIYFYGMNNTATKDSSDKFFKEQKY